MLTITRTVGMAAAFALYLGIMLPAFSQMPDHTIHAEYITQPSGPNSEFSINLFMSPSDIDIRSFEISVAYNNTQGTLLDVTDNTGQPQAEVFYLPGGERPMTGVGYVNVYQPLIMSTVWDLLFPVNLAQLDFKTTANYNDPQNQFFVHLTGRDQWEGPGDQYGGLRAIVDGMVRNIPTAYDSLEPLASVPDWSVY